MGMSTTGKRRGRPPSQRDRVVQALRDDIVSGRIGPSSRLPTQAVLTERFDVSTITLQRAIEQLADDGFVVSRPRQGVFVREHPPHLVDYCLIFPHTVAKMASNRFLFSLYQVAKELEAGGPQRMSIYTNIEYPGESVAYRDLVEQVQAHRTAGLVFMSRPVAFAGTPLLGTDGIPKVAIMGDLACPNVTAVRIGGYIGTALDWLAERGSTRLALLTVPMMSEPEVSLWMDAARIRGLSLPRHFVQSAAPDRPEWAQHCVHALMDRPADRRPDGLIIADDNLLPQASAGLLAAGVRVPEDCRVVAHANFPWATECLVPARRFGPDTRQVLRVCLDIIDGVRQGGEAPRLVDIPAITDRD